MHIAPLHPQKRTTSDMPQNTTKTLKAVFHAGMPKTGTSVLQNVLNQFDDPRLCYPKLFREGAIAHHALPNLLNSSEPGVSEQTLKTLHEFLSADQDAPVVFFSTEAFGRFFRPNKMAVIENICDFEDERLHVEFHYVLREMASFREAMYLQKSRVGRVILGFEEELEKTIQWVDKLFLTLSALRTSRPNQVHVKLLTRGFNSLAYFEPVLGLTEGDLTSRESTIRSTSRFGVKGESLIANLPALNEEFGIVADRDRIWRALSSGSLFADDNRKYTLYDAHLFYKTRDHALDLARKHGLSDYVESFADQQHREVEKVDIGYHRLNAEDKSEVLDFLSET